MNFDYEIKCIFSSIDICFKIGRKRLQHMDQFIVDFLICSTKYLKSISLDWLLDRKATRQFLIVWTETMMKRNLRKTTHTTMALNVKWYWNSELLTWKDNWVILNHRVVESSLTKRVGVRGSSFAWITWVPIGSFWVTLWVSAQIISMGYFSNPASKLG